MNKKKLFIGNLPWSIDSEQLNEIFSKFGKIVEAVVITERHSGRSKGFGFVEYETEEAAQKAVDELNEKEVEGRKIFVNIAKPKSEE